MAIRLNKKRLISRKKSLFSSFFVLVTVSLIFSGCVSSTDRSREAAPPAGPAISLENIMPVDPQPSETALSPGLLPRYHYNYLPTELDPTGQGAFTGRKGSLGEPVPNIDHGPEDLEVFGSGETRLIGVELTGFIRFPAPGNYSFKILVNDAARMFLGANMIIDDSEMGSDRYTNPAEIRIRDAGFYALKVQYYQRKGTSALQLFWKIPGGTDFEIVPSSVFFHGV